MTELEVEIGRTLGSSCFFVYHFVKNNPGVTPRDIEIQTGLTWGTVRSILERLNESNILDRQLMKGKSRLMTYKPNEKQETWKIH
jgi:predicted transcriptional regulator